MMDADQLEGLTLTTSSTPTRAVLFDWDGVLIDSQPAKSASWTLALAQIRTGAFDDLIEPLGDPVTSRHAVKTAMARIEDEHRHLFDRIARAAGLSRDDTRRLVWQLRGDYTGAASELDLGTLRNRVKDSLIRHASHAISGTRHLIDALHGQLPLGLVTQARRADVDQQAKAMGIALDRFDTIRCAGDALVGSGEDVKTLAYKEACVELGIDPADAIAIEDADGGLASAHAAGLTCIGLRQSGNVQALRLAGLVVPNLALLATADAVAILAGAPRDLLIPGLRQVVPGITTATSVGGRNITTVEIEASGPGTPIECVWASAIDSGEDPRHGIGRLIADQVRRMAGERFVRTVGLSVKGPIRHIDGEVFFGPWVVPPFAAPWPLEARMREALDAAGVAFGHIAILLDSVAAVLGEMHPRGTLAGCDSGVALILGTGIGCAIVEKGHVVADLDSDEAGDDRRRLYSSPGRHLILTDGMYEWLPISRGSSKANLQPSQEYFSERFGGAWLPRRVARHLLTSAAPNTLEATRISGSEARAYAAATASDPGMEIRLLAGLTKAAADGNEWARAELVSLGAELGLALAAFVWEFRSFNAVEHIVLVSSIGERLGTGVRMAGTKEDVFIDAARDALTASLVARDLDRVRAAAIAFGVVRSSIGREREYLAFDAM
jgi:beta-phosphoglucomutase-like phosphatase (HAD superfamily)